MKKVLSFFLASKLESFVPLAQSVPTKKSAPPLAQSVPTKKSAPVGAVHRKEVCASGRSAS